MEIKALNKSIIVKPDKPKEETTKSGIIIPETVKDGWEPEDAVVFSIGNGLYKNDKTQEIKVGDRIMFKRYTNKVIVYNKKKYVIINEMDVLGVYK